MSKVNNKNTRMASITANFEHILQPFLAFPLLTLNKKIFVRKKVIMKNELISWQFYKI